MSALFRSLARLFPATASPSGTAAGDLWWRSDVSQLHGSDGGTLPLTLGPTGNVPVVRSAGWHNLPSHGAVSTVSPPADRLFALPLWPGRSGTLTAIAVNVTLALAGGNVRMGLYASDGILPTTLIADYGTVTAGVTGLRQITGLSTTLRPVLQYLVLARQGGILTLTLSARDTWEPLVTETAATLTTSNNAYYTDGVTALCPHRSGPLPEPSPAPPPRSRSRKGAAWHWFCTPTSSGSPAGHWPPA
jgi:hypothetical protein